jgi:outer membrane protein
MTILFGSSAYAQKATTLKECLDYASTNNRNLKISGYELEVSQRKVYEQMGTYLPQVNASGSLDDNLKLSKQLLPAEMFGGTPGTYKAVSFGTKYNVSAGVQVTQSIFDPQFFVSLKTVKTNKLLSEQNQKKTHESVTYNISIGFYQALIIQKQLNVLKATLDASEESLKSAELRQKNGMAKQIDVDKLRVSFNNTKSSLKQTELSYSQSLNNLKNQMGMPLDSAIVLPDAIPDITFDKMATEAVTDSTIERRSDYQILKTNMALTELDKKKSMASYLPTLSAYYNYNYNAMNQEFKFYESDQKWFNSQSIGLKISIPIFSGFQRYQRLNQAKLNIAKSQENLKLNEQSIRVQISNYEIQYRNALDNIQNESENLDLAQRVYASTQLECKQGVSKTLDLVQAESSLREAQNNYFNKLLSLYIAKIDYEQSKGNLENFINNQLK